MSETLGDALNEIDAAWKADDNHALRCVLTMVNSRLGSLVDARIIRPTPDAKPYIVTREAAEAVGRQFWNATRLLRVDQLNDVDWNDLSPVRKLQLIEEGVAILTALGPFVVAEVGTFALLPGDEPVAVLMPPGIPKRAGTAPIIHDGDTIYIKRREEATDDS